MQHSRLPGDTLLSHFVLCAKMTDHVCPSIHYKLQQSDQTRSLLSHRTPSHFTWRFERSICLTEDFELVTPKCRCFYPSPVTNRRHWPQYSAVGPQKQTAGLYNRLMNKCVIIEVTEILYKELIYCWPGPSMQIGNVSIKLAIHW